jgi:hypothetical protein
MDTGSSRNEDVEFPRFNFLYRSNVKISHFGKFLLSNLLAGSLTPHIRPEMGEFFCKRLSLRHAPLGRITGIDVNGAMGRKMNDNEISRTRES